MENEMYEISPNSGRLRRKMRIKKHKPKKKLKRRIISFIQHPIFIFSIVATTGVIVYYSLQEPAKKSGKNPTGKSVIINNKIQEDRTPE